MEPAEDQSFDLVAGSWLTNDMGQTPHIDSSSQYLAIGSTFESRTEEAKKDSFRSSF